MASNRHLGRIIALQTLYEHDFRVMSGDDSADLGKILDRNIARYQDTVDDTKFIRDIVEGVDKKLSEIDDTIRPLAPEWPVEQIARVDKVILRIALHELLMSDDVPPKVVINEAVELAKSFGGDNSSKFINGVLGTAYRQKFGDEKPDKAKVKDKKPAKQTAKKAETKKPAAKKRSAKPKAKPKTTKKKD
ncbi:MAG: transcription antitermination factor NusB [Candidatus Saccharimonadales bacterium]|nr:transcription antitermination factor NusB [Candidatus Saccharimonadales bacterium]